jgi:hypothetical protein
MVVVNLSIIIESADASHKEPLSIDDLQTHILKHSPPHRPYKAAVLKTHLAAGLFKNHETCCVKL